MTLQNADQSQGGMCMQQGMPVAYKDSADHASTFAVVMETPSPCTWSCNMPAVQPAAATQQLFGGFTWAQVLERLWSDPQASKAVVSGSPVEEAEREWARDKVGRLRTRSQFTSIFGSCRSDGMWVNQSRKHGV